MKSRQPSHALRPEPIRVVGGAGSRFGSATGGIRRTLLLLLAAAALLGLIATWVFLPRLAAAQLAQRTRFDVSLDHLRVNPFAGRLDAQDLVLENPAVFGPREFMQVKTLRVDVRPLSWLSEQRVVEELVLDLPLVVLVTNTDGTTNLDLFLERWRGGAEKGPPRERGVLIKRLQLRVGEVRLVNLRSRQPRPRQMRLDFEYSYQGVTGWADLLVPALMQRLALAGGDLQDLDPEDLGAVAGGLLRGGLGRAPEVERRSTATLKSLFEKLEEKPKP